MKFLSFLIGVTIIFASLNLESAYAQQENIVLLYTFDEDTGAVAKDLSSKGNDGAITDCKWTADGKFGGGIEFNGETSVIEVPHDDSLDPGEDQITIMAWYNPLAFTGTYPPIARKGSMAESGWGFDTLEGDLRGFLYKDQGVFTVVNGGTMKQGQWNHVAMVYDGKEIRIYLNGELSESEECSGDINLSVSSVWIGKKADEDNYLHGIMDDLAILNIALTEAQIEEYMEGGLTAVEASGKSAISWGEIKNQ